jgi:hypothetical protein
MFSKVLTPLIGMHGIRSMVINQLKDIFLDTLCLMPDDFILIKGRTLALNGLIGQNVQWFPLYVGQFHEMVGQCG